MPISQAISRRGFLGLMTAAGAMVAAGQAKAMSEGEISKTSVGLPPASGAWKILEHATDGTDPSLSIATELPRLTPEIRKLAGTRVTLKGYVQALNAGFGGSEYLLSRLPMHCNFCYSGGRASLALVKAPKALELASGKPVTLEGVLALQETDPADYYFILTDVSVKA